MKKIYIRNEGSLTSREDRIVAAAKRRIHKVSKIRDEYTKYTSIYESMIKGRKRSYSALQDRSLNKYGSKVFRYGVLEPFQESSGRKSFTLKEYSRVILEEMDLTEKQSVAGYYNMMQFYNSGAAKGTEVGEIMDDYIQEFGKFPTASEWYRTGGGELYRRLKAAGLQDEALNSPKKRKTITIRR